MILRLTGGLLGGAGVAALLAACGDAQSPPRGAVVAPVDQPQSPDGDLAARVRQGSGELALVTPPATSIAGAAGSANLPAEVVAARTPRLVKSGPGARSAIDAWRATGWNTNFDISLVNLEELMSGGVPRDGIPPIDEPKFVTTAEADAWLKGREPVVALEVGGAAKAYPLQILTWHELVNDLADDVPVAVTFCPLCNSSVVFDRRVYGAILRFGVSGNLRHSDLIMWDNLTQSWWQQLTGEGIVGDLAGVQLRPLASQLIAYDEFKASYPRGTVLGRDTGHDRPYGVNPYAGYDSTDGRPFLFDGRLDERLRPMDRVVAVSAGGEDVAYPFAELAKTRAINDSVGGQPIVVLWTPGTASALDRPSIADGASVGSGVAFGRVLDGRALTLQPADGAFRDAETGSAWSITGVATAGPLQGQRLVPLLHANHFWFAWAAFKPGTRIYRDG